LTNKQTDKSDRQTPLKTYTSLRYATPVGKYNFIFVVDFVEHVVIISLHTEPGYVSAGPKSTISGTIRESVVRFDD